MKSTDHDIRALRWEAPAVLVMLDQRALPGRMHWLRAETAEAVAAAIRDMAVRGAPAIGIAAAYGVVLSALRRQHESAPARLAGMEADLALLAAARPTAVNLFHALARMRACLTGGADAETLLAEARAIESEDLARNLAMAEAGARLVEPGSVVLTHCNTGSLATGGHGTALGVIRTAWRAGRLSRIFATETRPWLQGARLTVWELAQDGIPVTLITDSAAATTLRTAAVRWVIVGADRIAANGDVANKIGTLGLALLARAEGVRFMVVAPSTTVDMQLQAGGDIPIESRDAQEVWAATGTTALPTGVSVHNPAFDVTPAALVDALVTERGVIEKPGLANMQEAFINGQ